MLAILFKTLPFFALIGVGYYAGRTRFFTAEATAWLTKFVFYFALSAMLFRFAANLSLAEIWDPAFAAAYLLACAVVYLIAISVAMMRRISMAEAAIEGQCAVIGNTGFLGIPMLVMLMGPEAAGPLIMLLAIDLIVFSTLITLIMTAAREGRMSFGMLRLLVVGLFKNPMIVSMSLGLAWSSTGFAVPDVINEFMALLGGAATPGALFAIGASLATRSAERMAVAGWLSFCKLVLHPIAVAFTALWVFDVAPYPASVMIAASALPVAGNVYMLAQHFGVAPQRVSASILISTAISILTVTIVIGLVTGPHFTG
jgi:predicted permease